MNRKEFKPRQQHGSGRATMRRSQNTRGQLQAGRGQKALQGVQRKYLRGPIIDAELQASREERLDALPDSAFIGDRVRSFVAVSSWFWQCYPCVQPNESGERDLGEEH